MSQLEMREPEFTMKLANLAILLRRSTKFGLVMIATLMVTASYAQAPKVGEAPSKMADPRLLTKAEQTQFQETSKHAECVEFCQQLAMRSEYIDFKLFGYSAQQRELPLLVLSKQKFFYATQLESNDAPIVFIQNAIHPGECAGKDASLMLLRDIALNGKHAEVLENVILVVAPILNADGHERFGPFSRINQNGPKEMGWRTTARNLNLNRDFMKLDAIETRSLIHSLNSWSPDFFIDTHTTDGGDWQYDVGYSFASMAMMEEPVRQWLTDEWIDKVPAALVEAGHVPVEYFNLLDSRAPNKGMADHVFTPRYATGYVTLLNRPSLLIETHMLKPYKQRVMAQYNMILQSLKTIAKNPAALKKAVREADALTSAWAKSSAEAASMAKGRLPIRFKHREQAEPVTFKGFEHTVSESRISGSKRIRYNAAKKMEMEIGRFRAEAVVDSVEPPFAYVVPPEWTELVELLRAHGIKAERLQGPATVAGDVFTLTEPEFAPRPYEGRFRVKFKTSVKQQ
ncbi:MAG: M14 family metallopeptidase, partial [Phycisphaerae bacterium]